MNPDAPRERDYTVTVQRIIRAPRNRMYAAWLDPELRKKWWLGLDRSSPTVCDIDARVGGRYQMDMLGEQQRWVMKGAFLELIEDQKIVFTWTCNDPLDEVRDNVVTVLFDDVFGGHQTLNLKSNRNPIEPSTNR